MKFHYVTVVWGEDYTFHYLKYTMPGQLSPGNLTGFAREHETVYRIYATSQAAESIKTAPAYERLSSIVETDIKIIDGGDFSAKHDMLTSCHKDSIDEAKSRGAAIVFLAPDSFFSDGSFMSLARLARDGKKVVMIAGLRVEKETFIPAASRLIDPADGFSISVSSAQLTRLAMEHLHPFSKTVFWNQDRITTLPSHLYWSVENEGIIARCFHVHPLMVDIGNIGSSFFSGTIDDDFLEGLELKPEELYVVEDSDEIMACEYSASNQFSMLESMPARAINIAYWADINTRRLHREFFGHRIVFHCEKTSPAWKEAESASDRVVKRTLAYLGSNIFLILSRMLRWWRIKWSPIRVSLIRFIAKMGIGKLYRIITGKGYFEKRG